MKAKKRMRVEPKFVLLGAVLFMYIAASAQASSQDRPGERPANISEEVARIQNNPDAEMRYNAVKRLTIGLRIDSSRVSEGDVVALTSLLRDSNDLVRHQAAIALGRIGPRASSAIPALQKALSEVQCVRADNNSRFAIAIALRRIGASPAHIECIATPEYGLEARRNPARE